MLKTFELEIGETVVLDSAVTLVGALLTANGLAGASVSIKNGAELVGIYNGDLAANTSVAVYVPLPSIRLQAGTSLQNGDTVAWLFNSAGS